MPELSNEDIKDFRELSTSVTQIKTSLLGINGDKGLVGKVEELHEDIVKIGDKQDEFVLSNQEEHKNIIEENEEDHHILSRNFWILVAALISSGVLSVGILKLLG